MRYLHALNKISGVGPQKMKKLLNYFSDGETAWNADLDDLTRSGVGEKLAENIFLARKNINPDFEWEKMEKEKIEMIVFSERGYPQILKESPNPPYIIYTKGKLDLNDAPMIAIVGARKNSSYGAQIARSFAKELSQAGLIVVSGMALGIDTYAHRGALDAHGKTVAVLGNSLDDANIYPRENFNLSREICDSGMLLSEYPAEMKAGTLTFPARNRIVAGLTLGTLVVEAGEKSGALITSQMALDANRQVFSVPGSIFSEASFGTNNLIKSGAKTVTGVRDILEELNLTEKNMKQKMVPKEPTNQEEALILKVLSSDPLHIDNISKMTKLQTATISGTLTMMEIKGWVKNIGGQNYIVL
jgi:DNA processing protein